MTDKYVKWEALDKMNCGRTFQCGILVSMPVTTCYFQNLLKTYKHEGTAISWDHSFMSDKVDRAHLGDFSGPG